MAKWLAGISIGFVAGAVAVWLYGLAFPEAPRRPVEQAATAPPSRVSPSSVPPLSSVPDAAAPLRTLTAILGVPSDFEQAVLLYNLIRSADAQFLDGLLTEADTLRPRREGEAAKSIIYGRYAEVDPAGALARITSRGGREERFLSRLFRAWAKHDLDGALAAAETLEEAHRRQAGAAILSVTEHLHEDRRFEIAESLSAQETLQRMRAEENLEVDPALAWRDAVASERGPAREQALLHIAHSWLARDPENAMAAVDGLGRQADGWRAGLVGQWAERDREAATAWVLAQPASAARAQMVEGLAGAIAQSSPMEALGFADQFTGNERNVATEAAFRTWGEKDPGAALEAWTQRRPQGFQWLDAWLVMRWADRDAAAAFEWAAAQPPSSSRPHLLNTTLRKLAETDPRGALARAEELRGSERERAIAAALSEWAQRDHRAAASWVAGNDALAVGARRSALASVLRVWGAKDARAALNWLLAQPESWHEAATSIIDALAVEYPDRAARLVELLPDPEVRAEARRSLAFAWANEEPEAALRWASEVEDVEERLALHSAIVRRWAFHDRQAAASGVRLLRPGKERDSARNALIVATLHEDVEFAEDVYLRINDEDFLREAAALLYHYWEGVDSKRARRYARAADFEDEEQPDLVD